MADSTKADNTIVDNTTVDNTMVDSTIPKANEVNCDLCNKTFTKTRHWQSFCSDKCRKKWYNTLRSWADYRIRNYKEDKDDFRRFAGLK